MERIDKKVKIIIAVVSMLIAIALITGASFAWFSLSTAPRIERMDVKVPNSGILEIALSEKSQFEGEGSSIEATGPDEVGINDLAKGQTTWGREVILGEESRVQLQAPASFQEDTETGRMALSTIKYADDARTEGFTPLKRGEVDEQGMIHYTAVTPAGQMYINKEGHIETAAEDIPFTAAGGAAVWLRSNRDTAVSASLNGITVKSGSLTDPNTDTSGDFEAVPVGIVLKVWMLEPDSGGVPQGGAHGTLTELGSVELTGIDTSASSALAEVELFGSGDIDEMKAGQIYLVEIISYVEGDRSKNPNAVIGKTVGERTITIGIEDVSFNTPDGENE